MSRFAVLLLIFCVLTGCGSSKTVTDDAKSPGAKKTGAADNSQNGKTAKPLPPYTPPTEVKLTPASPDDLKKFIAEHKGQIVLVDYWATWCAPCKSAFPHTLKLGQKHAKDGLVVVSVCLDAVDAGKAASEFLKSANANIVNFGSSIDEDTAFTAFEIDGGAIPHYKVFGIDGKLILAAHGGQEAEVDNAVAKALGTK